MDRRQFFQWSGTVGAAMAASGCASTKTVNREVGVTGNLGDNPFQHGVASGDPLADRVVLWTRITPVVTAGDSPAPPIDVSWWIGQDREGKHPAAKGVTSTNAARDFTIKVDAANLTPDSRYYYGFTADGHKSRVGQTRTAPQGDVASVRLAVTSCANYPQGYFNAYREIADSNQYNAVLSLGDYIYEYANNEYGNGEALGRLPEPAHEIVSLRDYRLRHAQHKAETDLQDAHAAHPWIVIWDDHESANNSWSGGAQNHNDGEGEWNARRAAAIQAYYEWMPIREVPTGLYRQFRFGNLMDLTMLDTRLEGRDEQGGREDFALANQPERQLLGPIQEARFLEHLTQAQAEQVRWKLVGQQVVFTPWADSGAAFNPDSWDGYRAARERVLAHVVADNIDNLVILTGDVHSSWGMEVPREEGGDAIAIELVTPAVSSPPLASTSPALRDLVKRAETEQAHIKYVDGLNNGYLVVDLNAERARAEWRTTGPRDLRSSNSTLAQALECPTGSNRLG